MRVGCQGSSLAQNQQKTDVRFNVGSECVSLVLALSLAAHDLSGPPQPDSVQRFGAQERRKPARPDLAFALPGECPHHFLAGVNGTGLFSRSNGELVAIQLEKSHLVLPRQKLIPGYVDLGRELVALDCEWTRVNHECLEEGG